MKSSRKRPLLVFFLYLLCNLSFLSKEARCDLVISEIMYNPGGLPEETGSEYIEIYNGSDVAFDLQGYRLDKGVDFLFQGGVIESNSYIVVAANLSIFEQRYPGVENVVGPWEGKLKNSGERIVLRDGQGEKVDEVNYADEGDWAIRARGPDDRGYRGWGWSAEHDGQGKSLELINPLLANNNGQNWGSSLEVEANVVGEISRTIGQIGDHFSNKGFTIGELKCPIVWLDADPSKLIAGQDLSGGDFPVMAASSTDQLNRLLPWGEALVRT